MATSPDRRPDSAWTPIKSYGPGEEPEVHRWAGGVTWFAHPGERMRRASHALVVDDAGSLVVGKRAGGGGDHDAEPVATADSGAGDDGTDPDVWVVEPVDAAGLDGLLADLGTVAGVVVLGGLHRRDAAAVAARHGVAVHVPEVLGWLVPRLDAPVEVFERRLADTAFEAVPLYGGRPWHEAALHDPASGTLVVTESLVTSADPKLAGERLAFSPYTRVAPPRAALDDRAVERVLVGHGEPVLSDADAALAAAFATARRGALSLWLRNLAYVLRASYVALRD